MEEVELFTVPKAGVLLLERVDLLRLVVVAEGGGKGEFERNLLLVVVVVVVDVDNDDEEGSREVGSREGIRREREYRVLLLLLLLVPLSSNRIMQLREGDKVVDRNRRKSQRDFVLVRARL